MGDLAIGASGTAGAGGDADAFERAYREHARGVVAVAQRVLGDGAQAQDVAHDVFLGLWSDPTHFDAGRGPVGHYLRMVARSRAVDGWREAQVAARACDRVGAGMAGEGGRVDERPVAAAERGEACAAVRAALMRLPACQREPIVLAYWGGLTAAEIAAASTTPVGTVKSRIRMGMLRLRAELSVELDGAGAGAALAA